MPLVLPTIAFILIFFAVRRLQTARTIERGGWEATCVIASAFWGAGLALSVEILGLAGAVRPQTVIASWLVMAGAAGAGLLIRRARLPAWHSGRILRERLSRSETAFCLLLAIALMLLLAIAWASPPNNVDSLLYHMSRVVHWAQNGSLRHYATGYGHQLWNPPWAEMAILNLRLLWGDDRPANLVQWSGLVGSLVAVSGVARLLGLGRRGRMLAVAFAFSIPMALLQATSTQNDLVASYWLIAALLLVLLMGQRDQTAGRLELLAFGASVGLGLLSKGTHYAFSLPVLVMFLFLRDWRGRPWRALGDVCLVLAVVLILNLGYWARNIATAGNPLGPADWIAGHSPAGGSLNALVSRVQAIPLLVVRAASLHLATPWEPVNQFVARAIHSLPGSAALRNDGFEIAWGWNHEDMAGNPVHLVIVLAGLATAAVTWKRQPRLILAVALAATAGYFLLALLALQSTGPFGTRLQLPFFVLSAPWVAAIVLTARPRWLPGALTFGLLMLSLPWILFNATRPVIALAPEPGPWELPCTDTFGCTKVGSVFSASRVDLLFANTREFQQGYTSAIDALGETGCRRVGLRIDSSDPEYPLWFLAEAPQSGFRFETIFTTESLEGLIDRDFAPCAVICTICGDRLRLHGMDLLRETAGVKLFAGDRFTWDEDG